MVCEENPKEYTLTKTEEDKEEKEEEEEEFPKNVARAFGCLYAKKKDQTQTFYTN
jgi:hypothetical protein